MNKHLGLIAAILGLMFTPSAIKADEAGITVTATGQSNIKPNRLEIQVKAGASAELTGDAVVKYQDSLRRAKDAFAKLKIESLVISDEGTNVASGSVGNNPNNAFVNVVGGAPAAAKSEVNITKSLRLSVTGVDKMPEEQLVGLIAKLLDSAMDVGIAAGTDDSSSLVMRLNGMGGSQSMVTFIADDIAAARKKASEDAFAKAKQNAEQLAAMAGARLGPVLSMEETSLGGGKEQSMQERMIEMVYGGGKAASGDPRLTSSALVELPVRVNLRVRFALEPTGTGK